MPLRDLSFEKYYYEDFVRNGTSLPTVFFFLFFLKYLSPLFLVDIVLRSSEGRGLDMPVIKTSAVRDFKGILLEKLEKLIVFQKVMGR